MLLTLTPAYGRDYKSKKAVVADWEANRDFVINTFLHPDDGKYINRQDAINAGMREVTIRYKQLTQVCVIKVEA